ncbi:MAG TPA: GPW/gp25 family protein [Enhygromyxa sp.]|nr:GPW/gp25 family protein [Enhygromyxa sp.]
MSAREHADLLVEFRDDGLVDLALRGHDLTSTSGRDNLVQALQLRLLTMRGELGRLGHPRYGSRVHELIGEPITRANLELLRRYVRAAILSDPRVAKIVSLEVRPLRAEPGAVDVTATIQPDPRKLIGPAFEFGVILDVG